MCPMEEGIIACELNYLPLGEENYLDYIGDVLALIEESGLDYEIGSMSTLIRGRAEDVFLGLAKINSYSREKNIQYTMNIILSNTCGC